MRLLALAEALRERGIESTFALSPGAMAMATVVERAGFATETVWAASGHASDSQSVLALARDRAADSVVCDGLSFGARYFDQLRAAGLRTVAIDDTGRDVPADVVVNAAMLDAPAPGRKTRAAVELTGAEHALIRSEFHRFPPAAADPHAALPTCGSRKPRLLLACGAVDSTGAAARLLSLLPRRQPLAVSVLQGPQCSNARQLALAADAATAAGHAVEIVGRDGHVSVEMAHADVAVCTGAGTLWELAYFGVPTLALATSSRQESLVAALRRRGAVHGGCWLKSAPDALITGLIDELIGDMALRRRLHRAFSTLVDGLGAARIARHIDNATAVVEARAA